MRVAADCNEIRCLLSLPTITRSVRGPQARTVGARQVPGLTRQIFFYPNGQW